MRRHVVAGLIAVVGLVSQTDGIGAEQQPVQAAQPTAQPAPQPGAQPSNQAKLAELRSAREVQAELDAIAAREVVPLQLQVVVARYQGEKRMSSMPYLLSINSVNSPQFSGSLRMGTKIAVPSTTTSEGKSTTTFEYQDIGTSIDAYATRRADGAFNIGLTVADSSVYPDDQKTAPVSTPPVIRSFQSTNRLILKDGQTTQFTAATDRLSGDVVRVEVTLRIQK